MNSPCLAHPSPNPQPILKWNLSTPDPTSLISFLFLLIPLFILSENDLFQLLMLIIFFILCVNPTASFIFSVRKKFKHTALETMNIFLSTNCKQSRKEDIPIMGRFQCCFVSMKAGNSGGRRQDWMLLKQNFIVSV